MTINYFNDKLFIRDAEFRSFAQLMRGEFKLNAQNVSFGEILKRERTNQDLSLRQLSEISNIEASYINRLEKGNRDNPGFSTVCALSKALNLNGDEVLRSFGYDSLGTTQTAESNEMDQIESLIKAYITKADNLNGFIPNIISLIEDLRTNYQNR